MPFAWHRMLFRGRRGLRDVGRYRTNEEPMQVVSGAIHAPRVHFEAPPSSAVPREMKGFVNWFNRTAVSFEDVQKVCGAYDSGKCRAMKGAPCEPAPCPYLERGSATTPALPPGDIDRRTFTLQGVFAGALAGVALVGAALAAGVGRLAGNSSRSTGPVAGPSTLP